MEDIKNGAFLMEKNLSWFDMISASPALYSISLYLLERIFWIMRVLNYHYWLFFYQTEKSSNRICNSKGRNKYTSVVVCACYEVILVHIIYTQGKNTQAQKGHSCQRRPIPPALPPSAKKSLWEPNVKMRTLFLQGKFALAIGLYAILSDCLHL